MMKKWIFITISLVTVFVVSWLFWLISRPQPLTEAESNQAIEQILGRPVRQQTEIADVLTYQGKYFQLKYPGSARVFPLPSDTAAPDNQLESFSLDVPNPKRVVTIIISKGSQLIDLSGYQYRQSSISGYLHRQEDVNGQPVHTFTKSEPDSEVTAYFQKGNLLMSLSITGRQSNEVQTLFDQLVTQIDWISSNTTAN